MFHSQTSRPLQCHPVMSTKRTEDFHSQVNCTSKIVLATCDFTFTHKSTQDVLASAPPTFTHKSTALPRLCLPLVTLLSLTSHTNVLSKCTPKNVLPKCTVMFISKASSLLTSSHSGQARHCGTSLFVLQYSCSCELDATTLPQVLCIKRPLWAWICSWCSVSL